MNTTTKNQNEATYLDLTDVLCTLDRMAILSVFDCFKCIFCQCDICNSENNCPAACKCADGSGYRVLCAELKVSDWQMTRGLRGLVVL